VSRQGKDRAGQDEARQQSGGGAVKDTDKHGGSSTRDCVSYPFWINPIDGDGDEWRSTRARGSSCHHVEASCCETCSEPVRLTRRRRAVAVVVFLDAKGGGCRSRVTAKVSLAC